MRVGVVLLAGGKSRRMGKDKAGLHVDGQGFLQRLGETFSGCPERILALGETPRHSLAGYTAVKDTFADCGPMAGLHAALAECQSDMLLCVPCDVPLFSRALGEYLVAQMEDGLDAVVPVTRDGQAHPFCGVYRKAVHTVLETRLRSRNCRMMDALPQLRVHFAQLAHTEFSDGLLRNVNTPEDYVALQKALAQGLPPV